jgi:hypothetical protein
MQSKSKTIFAVSRTVVAVFLNFIAEIYGGVVVVL